MVGQVNEVVNLFKDLKKQAFKRLCNYLKPIVTE
jgi:hypothetical protein